MSYAAIRFPMIPWQAGAHPLERKKSGPDQPLALLEFAPGFADPNWCPRGHAGYVLEGSLTFEFDGHIEPIGPGEGFKIDPGTPHRASNPGTVPVRVFIVSTPAG